MDRTEFLKIMRESLERKIPQAEIEDNLRYYREYFEQSAGSDEEVCEELGDPRLIAQSVTKAYLASKGTAAEQYTQEARREYSQMHGGHSMDGYGRMHGADATYEDGQESYGGYFLHRFFRVVIIIALALVILLLLRLALAFLLPILLVILLWQLIRRDR